MSELHEFLTDVLGFTMSAEFVPYSQSRNAGEWESINWNLTIKKGSILPLVIPYSVGIGHLPKPFNRLVRYKWEHSAQIYMIEYGVIVKKTQMPPDYFVSTRKKLDPPTIEDVFYSLVSDGSADFDALTFEQWASDFGYDVDSIKARDTWKECVRIGAWIRGAIGMDNVEQLRELYQDY